VTLKRKFRQDEMKAAFLRFSDIKQEFIANMYLFYYLTNKDQLNKRFRFSSFFR